MKAGLGRRTLLLGGVGMAGAALAACGASSSGSGNAPSATVDNTPKIQVKQGTTLQWMYWSSPGPWLEANQKEATEFEKLNTKYALKIEQMNVPSGQPFLDKLNSLLAGG